MARPRSSAGSRRRRCRGPPRPRRTSPRCGRPTRSGDTPCSAAASATLGPCSSVPVRNFDLVAEQPVPPRDRVRVDGRVRRAEVRRVVDVVDRRRQVEARHLGSVPALLALLARAAALQRRLVRATPRHAERRGDRRGGVADRRAARRARRPPRARRRRRRRVARRRRRRRATTSPRGAAPRRSPRRARRASRAAPLRGAWSARGTAPPADRRGRRRGRASVAASRDGASKSDRGARLGAQRREPLGALRALPREEALDAEPLGRRGPRRRGRRARQRGRGPPSPTGRARRPRRRAARRGPRRPGCPRR